MTSLALVLGVVLGVVIRALWPAKRPDAVTLTVPRDAVYARACVLVDLADDAHSSSHGEAKRHQVLAQLQKDFPDARDLGVVIEAALRG